ncbi:MAG: T9SS type A sorting domain-containing protein, partial [Candidatus Coatesbacteria bacterium]|nr:T9SS type A sorting domain-containing protein [Candidatus Coatesbacteria bacterium]
AALRNGPVGTAMQATAMMLRFYKGGTLGEEAPSLNIGYPLNHGVVIVGWDDARNGGSWKWKNSWGTGWGEQGYGWTRFGTSEMGAYTWSCTAFSEGSQKSITVTYPNGGERLQGNSQIYIRWTTTGTINLVDLFLTTNSGSSWAAIATRQNNNGSYGWTVPNIDAISCKIRVKDSEDTGTTSYDDSDRTFEIYKSTGFKYAKDAMYLPSRLSLSVSPSPFFSSAKVSFNLPVSDKVVIEVYDIQGRLAKKMTSAYYNAGSHTIIWNANDLPTGAYIVKMLTNNTTITRNILHLK